MKSITETNTIFQCLPEREALRKYPNENWLVIGHLTHAKPTSAAAQIEHFKTMIHALGYPNRVFSRNLHWVVRVGGHPEHIHLHFLLGRHQLTDGKKHSYSPDEVVSFLKNSWKAHGMSRIEIFDSSRPGIDYVLRREPESHGNEVEMSEELIRQIKKNQRAEERDPVVDDVVAMLRSQGVKAGSGDMMQAIRRGAA